MRQTDQKFGLVFGRPNQVVATPNPLPEFEVMQWAADVKYCMQGMYQAPS